MKKHDAGQTHHYIIAVHTHRTTVCVLMRGANLRNSVESLALSSLFELAIPSFKAEGGDRGHPRRKCQCGETGAQLVGSN